MPVPVGVKPPFSIPPTKTILRRRRRSGYRAVGTFSGCGGSSLGLAWAGIETVLAYEFDPVAAETYRQNHPTDLRVIDIRQVSAGDVLEAVGLEAGELDLFEGSPPCSKFSMAGKRHKSWGQVTGSDSTIRQSNVEDLFFDWLKLVDGIRPRVAIAENVIGLSTGAAKGYFIEIVDRFRQLGYRVQVWRLDASWLGVPQQRERLIFVGVRDDLVGDPTPPDPLPYRYSIVDACPWLEGARIYDGRHERTHAGRRRGFLVSAGQRPSPTITTGFSGWSIGQLIEPVGRENPDAADCYIAGACAADRIRTYTLGELRRICGFPDDYWLPAARSAAWARLGNAVMPPMYLAVGRQIVGFLDDQS